MALPSSGQLSASAINTELNRSSTLTISLASAAGGSYATINTTSQSYPNNVTPHLMSEWHSYNHSAVASECYEVTSVGATEFNWTDSNGVFRTDNIGASTTLYVCSSTTPYETSAADLTVTPCSTTCYQVHTTAAQASGNPCSC